MKAYCAEAKEIWGKTDAYRGFEAKTKGHCNRKWDDLAKSMDGIMEEFAICMKKGEKPHSSEAQTCVKTAEPYTRELLSLHQ